MAHLLPEKEDRPVFKHLLVPVDLTDAHQPALEIAARLATENVGRTVTLVQR